MNKSNKNLLPIMKIVGNICVKPITMLLCMSIVLSLSLVTASAVSGTLYESESNNTYSTADQTCDDYNNYGKISSTSDIDWWKITFNYDGKANFYLGNIPTNCNYNLRLYSSNGTTLLASSTNGGNASELITYAVNANTTYYMRIYSSSGSSTAAQYLLRAKIYTTAIIMQGNTYSASDCGLFYTGLLNNGYSDFSTPGWTYNNSVPNQTRVTDSQFLGAKNYTVAYYSGHGSKSGAVPTLNAVPSDSSQNYGSSSPFNVATTLGVSGSNWQTDCEWSSSDQIRVLALAACYQLDSSIVLYYARIMRASGIKAIAGYHESAPGTGTDDNITSDFISYAEAGNSIWYSWKTANNNNGYQPWAVLLYQSNNNMYYRLPGFSGSTYSPPSSTASVYKYASFLTTPEIVSTSAKSSSGISDLPLTIYATETDGYVGSSEDVSREPVITDVSIPDDESIVLEALGKILTYDQIASTNRLDSSVVRQEVDPDKGVVEDSSTIIERTYWYYNTYESVKITDSFMCVSVDAEGVNYIGDKWKDFDFEIAENESKDKTDYITESEAISAAKTEAGNIYDSSDFIVYNCELAYTPIGNDIYRLCYEVISSNGTLYIDIESGDVIK